MPRSTSRPDILEQFASDPRDALLAEDGGNGDAPGASFSWRKDPARRRADVAYRTFLGALYFAALACFVVALMDPSSADQHQDDGAAGTAASRGASTFCDPASGWTSASGCTECDTTRWTYDADAGTCGECLDGRYGDRCQHLCPGARQSDDCGTACCGRGTCSDGRNGTGLCHCDVFFRNSLDHWQCRDCSRTVVLVSLAGVILFAFVPQGAHRKLAVVFRRCAYCPTVLVQNEIALAQGNFRFQVRQYSTLFWTCLLLLSQTSQMHSVSEAFNYLVCFILLLNSFSSASFLVRLAVGKAGYARARRRERDVAINEAQAQARDIRALENARMIDAAAITFDERIAAGGFGEVWRARYYELFRDTPVAVKKIYTTPENIGTVLSFVDGSGFVDREILLLMRLQHPRVVKLIGAGLLDPTAAETPGLGSDGLGSGKQLFLVSEFMSGGDLRNRLEDGGRPYRWADRMQVAKDVAQGMRYLHADMPGVGKQCLLHRDLKSLNILLDSKGRAKITDFGQSRMLDKMADGMASASAAADDDGGGGGGGGGTKARQDFLLTGRTGSVLWQAPEIMKQAAGNARYGTAADVFSFGVVLFEIVSRRLPWEEEQSLTAIRLKVLKGQRPALTEDERRSASTGGAAVLLELMEACWHADSAKRPSFPDICRRLEGAYSLV